MYTIDASVWVNSFDHQESGHQTSRQFLAFIGQEAIPIAAPTLILAEVAGAVSRTRKDIEQAHAFALALRSLPNLTLVNLDADLAEQSLRLAAEYGLRGQTPFMPPLRLRLALRWSAWTKNTSPG